LQTICAASERECSPLVKGCRPVGKRRIKIVLSEHTAENDTVVFQHACKMGLEGIVSKRLPSPSAQLVLIPQHHCKGSPDAVSASHVAPMIVVAANPMIKMPTANIMSAPSCRVWAGNNSSNLAARLCQVCHIFA